MTPSTNEFRCPHCAQPLSKFLLPDGTGWEQGAQWACFNDECTYYLEGWTWMRERYGTHASYRFRLVDASRQLASPLPVWSETACRDRIVSEGE